MSETCQKLAFTPPIVVLKSGLKYNWMKKLDRVNRPLLVANINCTSLLEIQNNNSISGRARIYVNESEAERQK